MIAVDEKEVAGKSSADVSRFLKGFPGTEVTLTIQRPGTKGEQKLTLNRAEVKVENVPYSGMLNEEVGLFSTYNIYKECRKKRSRCSQKTQRKQSKNERRCFRFERKWRWSFSRSR